MPLAKDLNISVDEYLAGEEKAQTKHELINSEAYAMAGASANHNRLVANMIKKISFHLEDKPCEPFASDMKLRIRDNFYYPDVVVDCEFDEDEPYYTETPKLLVEVISHSTRKTDEKTKFLEYIDIPTLVEYVIIEQDIADITVFKKSEQWRPMHYFLGDEIHFESIDLKLTVEEIYHKVRNNDVKEFLESKQKEP